MATVQELIVDPALKDIGVIAQGETPSTDERNDAFAALNQIISSWSNEPLYNQKHETFALAAGVSAYTMGSGGTWATTVRPVRVVGAHAYSGAFQQGVQVMPMPQYQAGIRNGQGVTAALPSQMGVDTAAPLVNVEVWPTPNVNASIKVQSWQPLTEFAALNTAVSFPAPGYEAALRAELAVAIAPMFGRNVPEALVGNMQRFHDRIRAANATVVPQPPAPPQQQ